MNQTVIAFYRRLLREDFPNAGELPEPSAFVEAVGGRLINCGNTGNYMQFYLRVADGRIAQIRYQCACEPVANVAVEILCSLAKGRTLDEAESLTEGPVLEALGCQDEELFKKATGLLALLREAIAICRSPDRARELAAAGDRTAKPSVSWDEALSKS